MAHARLLAKLNNPPAGLDYQLRTIFLRALESQVSLNTAALFALTHHKSDSATLRILSDMVDEGLVVRERQPYRGKWTYVYRLAP